MSRDVNGNYTLPAGNPVVPDTVIDTNWANPTMADIAAALSDSLSRTGLGGMLVPFRNTDGTQAAPGMTWGNEPASGWYRKSNGNFWYAVNGVDIFQITSTGIALAPGLVATNISGGLKVQDAQPAPFQQGEEWFKADDGQILMRYINPDASQTLVATSGAGGDFVPYGEKGVALGVATLDAGGQVPASQLGNAPPNQNVLINGGFTINQRGYVSAAVLAAGVYGHDRFKAGAAGGDYSFTQLNSNTQITIAAGKSLIQVVEDKNVQAAAFVLSWEGTAQARFAVNSATPAGAYAASPILITGQTPGAVMSVEFNTGTLGKAKLEAGTVATPFAFRPIAEETALCQRYYYNIPVFVTSSFAEGSQWSPNTIFTTVKFAVTMRVAPSDVYRSAGNILGCLSNSASNPSTDIQWQCATPDSAQLSLTVVGATAGSAYSIRGIASGKVGFSAEL